MELVNRRTGETLDKHLLQSFKADHMHWDFRTEQTDVQVTLTLAELKAAVALLEGRDR